MIPARLRAFFGRFPRLASVLDALQKAAVPYAIGGSGCLYLLGNERVPDDVDIYLPNDVHDRVDGLFGVTSYVYTSAQEEVRNSNPGGDHSIQLTSALTLDVAGKRYDLSLTPGVLEARLRFQDGNQEIFLYPPEDVLLIKALLQRGHEVGKHDKEDIAAFLRIYKGLRREYLAKRIRALGAEERVFDTLLLP